MTRRLNLPSHPRVGDQIAVGAQVGIIAELRPGHLILDDGTRLSWSLAKDPES